MKAIIKWHNENNLTFDLDTCLRDVNFKENKIIIYNRNNNKLLKFKYDGDEIIPI